MKYVGTLADPKNRRRLTHSTLATSACEVAIEDALIHEAKNRTHTSVPCTTPNSTYSVSVQDCPIGHLHSAWQARARDQSTTRSLVLEGLNLKQNHHRFRVNRANVSAKLAPGCLQEYGQVAPRQDFSTVPPVLLRRHHRSRIAQIEARRSLLNVDVLVQLLT